MKLLLINLFATLISSMGDQPKMAVRKDTAVQSSEGVYSECPVCMDVLVSGHTVYPPCAHLICQTCYEGIFKHLSAPTCPLCRGSYTAAHEVVPIPLPQNTTGENGNQNLWLTFRLLLRFIHQLLSIYYAFGGERLG
jgi:hypothetical protein